jgi:uncharacterized protein (TIGR03084 family)
MADITELCDDLTAESAEVDALVADLPDGTWAAATPAAGWTIAHQIAHLHWTDTTALKSITDVDAFGLDLAIAATDPAGFVDQFASASLRPPAELLPAWRDSRSALVKALLEAPREQRLPWYGVTMSPVSMATGRLMETWAHGQDIADTLRAGREHRVPGPAHLRIQFRDSRPSGSGRASPARADRTGRSLVDLRSGSRSRSDHRHRARLLLDRHAAPAPRRREPRRRRSDRSGLARGRSGVRRTARHRP